MSRNGSRPIRRRAEEGDLLRLAIVLRTRADAGGAPRRFVSDRCQVDPDGQGVVHCRLGGRVVAFATAALGLRCPLADHQASTQTEANAERQAQACPSVYVFTR